MYETEFVILLVKEMSENCRCIEWARLVRALLTLSEDYLLSLFGAVTPILGPRESEEPT